MKSKTIAAIGAAAAALSLAACGAAAAPSAERGPAGQPEFGGHLSEGACQAQADCQASRPAAVAYLRAHPVPGRPGMVAAIVLAVGYAAIPPASTGPGNILIVTGVTRSAATVTLTCGNMTARQPCDVPEAGKIAFLPGDYAYLATDGEITSAGGATFAGVDEITFGAVAVR